MQKNWKKYFSKSFWRNFPPIKNTLQWAKKTSLIGLHGVPLYNVVKFIFDEAKDDSITTRANSMTFSFFIALFPSIIFLFTLIPLLPTIADYALDIRESVRGLLPATSEEYLFSVVEDIVSRQRKGLLSFGLVLAMFFASNGMLSMISGFEKMDHRGTFRKRHWLQKRLVAVVLTIFVSTLFIISSALIVLGHVIINYLDLVFDLNNWAILGFSALRWLIIILLIYNIVAIIYKFAPPVRRRFSYFSVGTNIATFLIISVSVGFSYFVANFGKYNELYGSIGALIVTLLWFNIICFILLVGFEINASVAVNADLLQKQPEEEESTIIAKAEKLSGEDDHTTSDTTNILPPT